MDVDPGVMLADRIDACQYGPMTSTTLIARPADPDLGRDQACATAPVEGLSAEQSEQVAGVLKALADPVRLQLYSRIVAAADGEACVCDIQDVGVGQSTVSHHLKKLREAGVLISERRGTWVYYRAVPEALDAVRTVLDLARCSPGEQLVSSPGAAPEQGAVR